jgi:hypothetical protein
MVNNFLVFSNTKKEVEENLVRYLQGIFSQLDAVVERTLKSLINFLNSKSIETQLTSLDSLNYLLFQSGKQQQQRVIIIS